jgi:phosphoglycolate phosphatase-like HAD superfamily hydrolase
MNSIKLIALDIDGVLLEDTFSPIIRNYVLKHGVPYTRELERNVFSRPQEEAAQFLSKLMGKKIETIIKEYFEERERYINTYGCNINEGVPELLELLSSLKTRLIYYGGLREEQIVPGFNAYQSYFEQYICTNDFRPGIKEITIDIFGLEYNQVLFIDDVNSVAEVAKKNNVPFIGIPSNYPWGFQRQDMIATQVKYILSTVKEIDINLLERIDKEAFWGTIWKTESK